MKDADSAMDAIVRRIRKHGSILILDFDGVLSPLVKVPSKARISPAALQALAALTREMPVAVVTGRTLADIEKRVGLKGVIYAGSHGLEWRVNGRVHRKKMPREDLLVFKSARRSLVRHAKRFPKLFVEDKRHCLALGYRSLSSAEAKRFRVSALAVMEKFVRTGRVRVMDNLYTFEIVAASEWTKGECARHIYDTRAEENEVAIYIGDGLTDEDAFRALIDGITIRVGKSTASAAHYYFKSRSGVDRFLHRLARS